MLSRRGIYWAYIDQVLETLASKEDIPKLVEGLDKWSKPVDQISGFESSQIRRKSRRKQFYNKKFRGQN